MMTSIIFLLRSNHQHSRPRSTSNITAVTAPGSVALGWGTPPSRSTATALHYLTADSTMRPVVL